MYIINILDTLQREMRGNKTKIKNFLCKKELCINCVNKN